MRAARPRRAIGRLWRWILRLRERAQPSDEAFHLVLAGGVGVLGGAVNVLFHAVLASVQRLFLNRSGDPVLIAEAIGSTARLLTPALGGLLAGAILYLGGRLSGPQGSSNIVEVVVAGDGRLPFRTGVVKFVSSLATIASGGSIGREGAIVELSATLASKWGQLARWPPYRLRLLVGCGAASGIAAAYNAPISGAVFAALIVLGNFSMIVFAPLVFSSVIATMVSRSFLGTASWYSPAPFEFTRLSQLPWFVLVGVVCGAVGAIFLKLLGLSRRGFRGLGLPVAARLMLGGIIVGAVALRFPGVWGNGYEITNRIVSGEYTREPTALASLGGLSVAKLVATAATVGSGAVGGVFTPTLFLGASVGSTLGLELHRLGLGSDLPVTVFAMVGMGGLLAATTHSPLLAIIMILEISLDYTLMPALMLACVVGTLVARRFHPDSVYTEPLRARGRHAIRESAHIGAAVQSRVGDVMQAPVPPVRQSAPIQEVAERFITSAVNFLPVIDDQGSLVGVVALHDLKEFLGAGEQPSAVIAYDVMRPPPVCVTPDQLLLEVLPTVLASEQRKIPVVSSPTEKRLIGALMRAEVLSLFSEAIAESSQAAGRLDERRLWDERKGG